MGSVMRRHTSDGDVTTSTAKEESTLTRSWQRKGKSSAGSIQEVERGFTQSAIGGSNAGQDPISEDEGDPGIGRPFNVEVRPPTALCVIADMTARPSRTRVIGEHPSTMARGITSSGLI